MRAVRLILADKFWERVNIPVILSKEHSPGLLSTRAVRLIMTEILGM